MSEQTSDFNVLLAGSPAFLRRFSVVKLPAGARFIQQCELAELKASVIAERPHCTVLELPALSEDSDVEWLREQLTALRERFPELKVILACLNAERFLYAGEMLFKNAAALDPSALLDDLVLAAPASFNMPPEQQLADSLSFLSEAASSGAQLGHLNDEAWAPSLCDHESREIWFRWLPRYAHYTNENPLLTGPTGTGKTRLAYALHRLSGRSGPFITITPRDFSSSELVQAELFGAVQGAYTGAVDRWGLVKKAEKGTLFVDELQSIDLDLQGKIITFIENKTYRRVGDAESHRADVRFLFATNRPLAELVSAGKLRDDFAYRLERLQLSLKPLNKRRLDIAGGLCFALAKIRRERAGAVRGIVSGFTAQAYERLFFGAWPGNLRQLENVISHLMELAEIRKSRLIDDQCINDGARDSLADYGRTNSHVLESALMSVLTAVRKGELSTLPLLTGKLNEELLNAALEAAGGDFDKAAQIAGVHRNAVEIYFLSRTKGKSA